MNYFAVRTFDHTGFHESRLLLLSLVLLVSLYFLLTRRDYRYLALFFSGAFFQAIIEMAYTYMGFRAPTFSLTVFGAKLADYEAAIFQGATQGPVFSIFGLWFVDLCVNEPRRRQTKEAFLLICLAVLITSGAVAMMAKGRAVTSVRPLFGAHAVGLTMICMAVAAELGLLKENGRRLTFIFYCGLVLFSILHFAPMYLMGTRFFMGENAAPPPMAPHIVVGLWAHLVDFAAGKVHFFAVPLALGLAEMKRRRPGEDEQHFAVAV